jgi:hypothetical protein
MVWMILDDLISALGAFLVPFWFWGAWLLVSVSMSLPIRPSI